MSPPDPIFLATAVEIVLRAGEIQISRRASGFHVDKKGTIDLVTEVDLECEQMCRAVLAERFPAHDVLAEELSSGPRQPAAARYRWVFDPLDGTTNYAHGLPVFCASLALEVDGRAEVGAIYDPTRQELFTGERGQGAFLNGAPLRVSDADTLLDALLVTALAKNPHGRSPANANSGYGPSAGTSTRRPKTSVKMSIGAVGWISAHNTPSVIWL